MREPGKACPGGESAGPRGLAQRVLHRVPGAGGTGHEVFTRWSLRKPVAHLRKVHGRVISIGQSCLACQRHCSVVARPSVSPARPIGKVTTALTWTPATWSASHLPGAGATHAPVSWRCTP
ncbi:hypothetical protein [Streptomyces sp. SID3343]|uniref:hypothetical protein n=1 Tax=Streptomyces sp. SID3343 TaxID=2690260 RepID=UPI0031F8B90E